MNHLTVQRSRSFSTVSASRAMRGSRSHTHYSGRSTPPLLEQVVQGNLAPKWGSLFYIHRTRRLLPSFRRSITDRARGRSSARETCAYVGDDQLAKLVRGPKLRGRRRGSSAPRIGMRRRRFEGRIQIHHGRRTVRRRCAPPPELSCSMPPDCPLRSFRLPSPDLCRARVLRYWRAQLLPRRHLAYCSRCLR